MKQRGFTTQDEGGYLASVSDLMSGLIFIFIIMLVAFALGLQQQQDRLDRAKDERTELLRDLVDRLNVQQIKVEIDEKQGVLRLGERVLFAQARADLNDNARTTVHKLADVLMQVLPCYTRTPADIPRAGCEEKGRGGQVDALFIEGHTDDTLLSGTGRYRDNWELSMARARVIFNALIEASGGRLDKLTNGANQEVLGLSGYAERREVAPNDTPENKALNRRIDLRFVMVPPDVIEPVARTERGLAR